MADLATLSETVHEQTTLMVREMAEAIRDDCKSMIETRMQLVDPDEVGSPKIAAIPLAESTIETKRRLGAASPETPRLRFGELENSIVAGSLAEDTAFVGIAGDEDIANWQQYGTGEVRNKGHHRRVRGFAGNFAGIPPRPFFGVSAEAWAECHEISERTRQTIEVEFQGLNLPPQEINVSIGLGSQS